MPVKMPVFFFTRSLTDSLKNYMQPKPASEEGCGEVAERLKAPLSKSGILATTGIVGSNPTLSAIQRQIR